jgi:nitrate reductase delta subunit
MRLLRILSRLLCYPEAELKAAVPELRAAFAADRRLLPDVLCARLDSFLDELEFMPLLELQERYVITFDRGRALSLHLFEHVHGESRDRGQAMVDLMNRYRERGYLLDARELPDYLPLFLEYLSTQDQGEIDGMLGDAVDVIVLLGARLRERGSPYHILFEVLESLVGAPAHAAELREAASREGPDEAIERMDEIWEEEQVTFLANSDPGGGCSAGAGRQPAAAPVQWMDNPRRRGARST